MEKPEDQDGEAKTLILQNLVTVTPLTYEQHACKHMRIELIDARRLVHCEDCGRDIDAYDYLRTYSSRTLGHWARMAANAKDMADRLSAEIEDLDRQRRNLKASVRRLAKKA